MHSRSRFATLLRDARRSRDLTLTQVGEALDVGAAYLSDVEGDKRLPPRSGILRLWARTVGADEVEVILASGRPVEVHATTRADVLAAIAIADRV
jgi:transcriptional regulator with XRE-family HTH domain